MQSSQSKQYRKSIGTEGCDLRCSHTSAGFLTAAYLTHDFVAEWEDKALQPSSKMLKCSQIRKFSDPLSVTFRIFLSTEQRSANISAFLNRFYP